jgi:hypothetical protein
MSTGPRTAAGKQRCRMNALTHGLAMAKPAESAERSGKIAAVVEALAGRRPSSLRLAQAQRIASLVMELDRVAAAKHARLKQLLRPATDGEDIRVAAVTVELSYEMKRFERYERSAFAKLKRAIRHFDELGTAEQE